MKFLKPFLPLTVVIGGGVLVGLLAGCSDQPVDYIFIPTERNQTTVARTAVGIIDALYEHADQAVTYLDQAALTDEYISILPAGWQVMTLPDSVTGVLYDLYLRTYLDQKYYALRFDHYPQPGAVRMPSQLDYTFVELSTYRNAVTNTFYGNISEVAWVSVAYADQRRNTKEVEGWFEIQRTIGIEEEIETAGAGTYTYTNYVSVNWQVRVKDFTVEPVDSQSQLSFEALAPLYDEAGKYQRVHVTGRMLMNRDGSGSGEFYLNGEKSVELYLTHRTFGFQGYFKLLAGDFKKRVNI